MRVLVTHPDSQVRDGVAEELRDRGMAVDVADRADAAVRKACVFDYDVVVVDRMLATLAGSDPSPRILVLSGEEDAIDALNLGADDCMSAPFELEELVARVRALARRSGPVRPATLRHGDLVLDPARREATRRGVPVDLTRKELGVLEELLGAQGATVSTEQLLTRVWDENVDPFTNIVRVTVMTLRRKLGEPPLIETVNGVGYRIG